MSQAPDPADKGVDTFKGTTSHRAGYAQDPLEHALYWARKGGTLQAGEGLILAQEIDRLRAEIHRLVEHTIAHTLGGPRERER